jgi:ribosomal-protein-alanine N-acetyltransferase
VLIHGRSFVLRPWKRGDEVSLVENANNLKIARNLTEAFPHPYLKKDAREYVGGSISKKLRSEDFAIVVGGKAVGGIGIKKLPDPHKGTFEIGYWLGESYWGRGIVSQAVKLVTAYAFRRYKPVRLQAGVSSWNLASARVLKKAGFKREAVLKRHVLTRGKLGDEWIFVKFPNGK